MGRVQHLRLTATNAGQLMQLFSAGLHGPRLTTLEVLQASGDCSQLLAGLLGAPTLQRLALARAVAGAGQAPPLAVSAESLAGLCSSSLGLQSLELHLDKVVCGASGLSQLPTSLTRLCLRLERESAALAPEVLESLVQLRRLRLGNVRLAQFTPRLAQVLSGLTHLDCQDVLAARPHRRAGTTLWEGLRHLASLRELRLADLGSSGGMPAAALACPHLTGMTLISTAVAHWPQHPRAFTGSGGCLGRLRSLHLQSLMLAEPIPPATWHHLTALTALTWRDVTGIPPPGDEHADEAVSVPDELSALQSLEALCIEYAQLVQFPEAVQALTRLTRLGLEGNRLAALPATSGPMLEPLREIYLDNNHFDCCLPEALTACSNLTQLSIRMDLQAAVALMLPPRPGGVRLVPSQHAGGADPF